MNQEQKFLKLYAAFRSGCLGENVLNVYFSFLANILIEDGVSVVIANDLRIKFEDKYKFPIPLTFVRQVLAVGIRNGSIVDIKGQFQVVAEKLYEYKVDVNVFESSWKNLIEGFKTFCAMSNYSVDFNIVENSILEFVNFYDVGFVLNRDVYSDESTTPFNFAWNKFLQHISVKDVALFGFMTEICFSNILKEAIFYSESVTDDFGGLCVYLDSPLVFSVLGMDDKERVASFRHLVREMKDVGCSVKILDHNLNEVKGIITNAGSWASSTYYDISKANKVTRFFHDNQYDRESVTEFCADIEAMLSEYGITIKQTYFDIFENQFQEDESLLYGMVQEKYESSGFKVPIERESSIKVDVRSIIMLYRIRQGVTAQTIQDSKHIMITQNSVVANVCKQYESNKSINSGHVPVCISADIFGTVLWMYSPDKMLEYHRKQLLADCYSILKPSKKMLEKYVESITSANRAGEIDEKKYLFMRSHPVVVDALMNITMGDYARFTDRTYLEVYDDIIAMSEKKSEKKFSDEAMAHTATKKQLEEQIVTTNDVSSKLNDVNTKLIELEAKEQARFDNSCKNWSGLWTAIVYGVPYLVVNVASQVLISTIQGFSLVALLLISGLWLLPILVDTFAKKVVYSWVSKKVRSHMVKKEQRE